MRVLITAFEAFAGSPVNPSEQVVNAMQQAGLSGQQLFTSVLPVDAHTAPQILSDAIEASSPHIVIALGEAANRPVISIERAALNILDFRIPDNEGNTITDQPILPGGPAAYFSTLPVRAILKRLQASGIPAELSYSAGAYLCNMVFYLLMDWASRQPQPVQAGFIHLPSLPEQAAARGNSGPSMSLETSLQAIRAAIECAIEQHAQNGG